MSYNLLFVCTGNTCRSPMAEALARYALAGRGRDDVAVASAGTSAWPGSAASEEVPAVLDEIGVALDDHEATELSPERIEWADLILVMSPRHAMEVEQLGGRDKVAMVTGFMDGDAANRGVMDPIGAGLETYRRTRDQLRDAIDALVDHLDSAARP